MSSQKRNSITFEITERVTVRELKEFLEDLPDSMEIKMSNDMEGLIQVDDSSDTLIIDAW